MAQAAASWGTGPNSPPRPKRLREQGRQTRQTHVGQVPFPPPLVFVTFALKGHEEQLRFAFMVEPTGQVDAYTVQRGRKERPRRREMETKGKPIPLSTGVLACIFWFML